jgi:NADH-quinone oxidoreductase subunit E
MSSSPAEVAAPPLPREKVERFDHEVAEIIRRYPADRKASALIPVLRVAQELFGHLGNEALKLSADRCGVTPARADEVATFYVMFNTRPVGRHVVEVCTNVSCCLTGSEKLWAHLQKKLGVTPGQTTADGRITLREVECLGSCGTGPAMLIDDEMYERLTIAKVDELIGRLE